MAGTGQTSDTNTFGCCCVETGDKISRSLSDGKEEAFLQVWEKSVGRRWQLLAPENTDPPDIFAAVIYIHRPCPTRTGLAVGCFYVEIEGLSSRELFLISMLTIFDVKAQVPPRTAA